MSRFALVGARIVTPEGVRDDSALLVDGDRITGIVEVGHLPQERDVRKLDGGWLMPGFLDTQVNGGGDVLFNEHPTVDGVRTIAEAHRRFGTTGLLPTLISDDPHVVDAGMAAVDASIIGEVPGILGIHIEGPHLNSGKRGIHDASKFTFLDEHVVERLTRRSPGVKLLTLAPELAAPGLIERLVRGA
jgi:N-acetylglucosamine-6-phosphate deacetylase